MSQDKIDKLMEMRGNLYVEAGNDVAKTIEALISHALDVGIQQWLPDSSTG